MTISREDIDAAIRFCSAHQTHYQGPNPASIGMGIEDTAERERIIGEVWTVWAGFTRTYFMGMMNILGGMKPLMLESEIVKFCTPEEARGGRAAIEVFWRRDLARRAPIQTRGAHAINDIQRAILADDDINAEVFKAVELKMETDITQTLRTRRNLLRQIEPDGDHMAGLETDITLFFRGARPARLPAKVRNENYDGILF